MDVMAEPPAAAHSSHMINGTRIVFPAGFAGGFTNDEKADILERFSSDVPREYASIEESMPLRHAVITPYKKTRNVHVQLHAHGAPNYFVWRLATTRQRARARRDGRK